MELRVLVVIPAYNEEQAIAGVLLALRQAAPHFDRLVVNDGSSDATGEIVAALGEKQLRPVCNLGYGQALQTGLLYALACGYDVVVSLDADGQHDPADVPRLVDALTESGADLVIGSRFCDGRPYNTPIGRRLGQLLFSHLTQLLLGRRIYDTSSGFKAMRAPACQFIAGRVFMDLHLETIVQLTLAGYEILELPVHVRERTTGRSMHSIASIFHYPLKTVLLTLAAIMDAHLMRRRRKTRTP